MLRRISNFLDRQAHSGAAQLVLGLAQSSVVLMPIPLSRDVKIFDVVSGIAWIIIALDKHAKYSKLQSTQAAPH